MDAREVIALDTAALPWQERFNEKLGRALFRKELIIDPGTGMEVRLVRYPAGVINVRHTHRRRGFSLSMVVGVATASDRGFSSLFCRLSNLPIGFTES
jgi:hypothetical protein